MKFGKSPLGTINWKHFIDDIDPLRAFLYKEILFCDYRYKRAENTIVTRDRFCLYLLHDNYKHALFAHVKAYDLKSSTNYALTQRLLSEQYHYSVAIVNGISLDKIVGNYMVLSNLRLYGAYIIAKQIETSNTLTELLQSDTKENEEYIDHMNELIDQLNLRHEYEFVLNKRNEGSQFPGFLAILGKRWGSHSKFREELFGRLGKALYQQQSNIIHGTKWSLYFSEDKNVITAGKNGAIADPNEKQKIEIQRKFFDNMFDDLWK